MVAKLLPRWLHPPGFAARLALATSALITVVCVAQSWIVAGSDLEQVRRHLIDRGLTISEYLARQSATDVAAGNVDGLHQLSEQSRAQSRIVYSRFFDRDGLLLASMGQPPDGAAPRPAITQTYGVGPIAIGTDVWEFQAPIRGSDRRPSERLGTVAIGISIDMLQALRRQTFATASLLTSLCTLLAVLAAMAVARAITRPLKALAAAADEIAQGNFDTKVPARTQDEVGVLARSFNAMAESLAASRATLEEKVAELQRANGLKSEFLATVSHELRTPLNVIMGYVEMLTDGACGEVSTQQAEILAAVQRYSKLQHDLITNVLDFSRLSSGRVSLHPERFELASLLAEVEALYVGHLARRGVPLAVTVDARVSVLETDRIKVQEIVRNLIDNAVKFTDAGHIAVVVRPAIDPSRVIIEVTDTGRGIRKEDLGSIFDAFHQIGESRTRGTGGVGLGLSIVKQLVDALEGTISVSSRVGEGSTFRVELPRCVGTAAHAEPPLQEMPVQRARVARLFRRPGLGRAS